MAVHYLLKHGQKPPQKTTKKKSSHKFRNYADIKRRLNVVHKFSFRMPSATPTEKDIEKVTKRKSIQGLYAEGQLTNKQIEQHIKEQARDLAVNRRFSPQQKAAITRLWDGTEKTYGQKNSVKLLETGQAQFVPIKNASHKKLLGRMKKTNKGVYLFEKDVTVKKRGKGKDFRLEIIRDVVQDESRVIFRRKEQFFPFPPNVIIIDYIDMLSKKYNPDSVAIGVMSARGNVARSSISGLNYIEDAIEEYDRKGIKHPFSGVYFYWY